MTKLEPDENDEVMQLSLLFAYLGGLVTHARQELATMPRSLPLRTNLIRSVAAHAEGVAAALKGLVPSDSNLLSPAERLILQEQTPYLDRKGEVVLQPMYPQTLPNLRFAFSVYSRTHGITFTLPTDESGWSALSETISVRNRVSHPKRASELTISDGAIDRAVEAHEWLMAQHSRLVELIYDKTAFDAGFSAEDIRRFRQLRRDTWESVSRRLREGS